MRFKILMLSLVMFIVACGGDPTEQTESQETLEPQTEEVLDTSLENEPESEPETNLEPTTTDENSTTSSSTQESEVLLKIEKRIFDENELEKHISVPYEVIEIDR